MTTGSATSPAYIGAHWAKSDRQNPERIHLLEHHLADVGACFQELLAQPTIRGRLVHAGGLTDMPESTAQRLAAFAALHDIGKVNIGFQTRIWRSSDLPPGMHKPKPAGHTLDLMPILNEKDTQTLRWFMDVLGWDDFLQWDDNDGLTVSGMLIATLSHHGQPLHLESNKGPNTGVWRSFGDLDPQACVERIGRLIRLWYPAAFADDAPPLPSAPAFQHMFLGLCTLADWIGSDEKRFPFCDRPCDDYISVARKSAKQAIKAIGLNIQEQRAKRTAYDSVSDFSTLFHNIGSSPNAIQNRAALDTPLDEPLVLIESETGSGKTEAALWRFARMYELGIVDGIYFALPTRAAASQMLERIKRFTANLFQYDNIEPVLAVPGYLRAGDATGTGGGRLHDYKVWWDSHTDDAVVQRRWAAESAKRFLAAQVAVGTIDQAMMSALKVRHAHMRAACLARNLLVVDEVHASDIYMRKIIEALLNAHLDAGGYALLMSATLGSVARQSWFSRGRNTVSPISLKDAIDAPYPAVTTGARLTGVSKNDKRKSVRVEAMPAMSGAEFGSVAKCALRYANDGAKVLIIRNTVRYALSTQQALEAALDSEGHRLLFECKGKHTLHHSRFARHDRQLLDRAVEEHLGKGRSTGGRIIIGTQTLEQSLDIDADILITDLCPVDVLLQRIGRLHRHDRSDRPQGFREPRCVVLTPPGNDLSALLEASLNGIGPGGFVYEDLRILEATRRLVAEHSGSGVPWDIPDMNRELVERATHPEALDMIVDEMGDEWRAHANNVMGGQIADGLSAKDVIIRRDRDFYDGNDDVVFGSMEERIRTRLGDEGIEVKFQPALLSPFDGARIEALTVPHHMLGNINLPQEDESIIPTNTDGGFTFCIGERQYVYDRLGLRRI